MSIYLHSAVSHSACGASATEALTFAPSQFRQVEVGAELRCPYFAMTGAPPSQAEDRLYSLLFSVVSALIEEAGLTSEALSQTALMLGSTSLDISIYKPVAGQDIWLPPSDNITSRIVQKFGLSDFHLTFNTACTASINALNYGKRLLEQGKHKHVIVVGCEFYNELTLKGFNSLALFSGSEQVLAFHQQRDGLLLGEGVGALLLGREKPEREYVIELLEGHCSCDTFSLTTTHEDGSQIRQVIDKALQFSGLTTADIELVKVHGTATYSNDLSENNALQSAFPQVPILALKPFTGHTLGACGVLELALMDHLLQSDRELPRLNYCDEQPEQLLRPFASEGSKLSDYQHILLNHCGFGGNNAALVVKVSQ